MTSTKNWYSLSEAADQLDVHPSTIRRWADNGEIPVMITPGGHRRFAATEIENFSRVRSGRRPASDLENLWTGRVLAQVRQGVTEHKRESRWMAQTNEMEQQHGRLLGRQLMALTLQYISNGEEDEQILGEAGRLGRDYGLAAQAMGLTLTEALKTSIFFRDTLVEAALQLPEGMNIRPAANLRLLRQINRVLNEVHLEIARVYE